MPDMYAYVDPVSGNNGTAVISATPATAAALPYATLAAAETAGRQNLTTMGGDFYFRLLTGNLSVSGFVVAAANWPGSSTSRRLIFEGFGTGVHDGTFATTNGFTITATGAGTRAFEIDDIHHIVRYIRLRQTNFGEAYYHTTTNSSSVLDSVLFDTADGPSIRPQSAVGFPCTIKNCAAISRTGDALRIGSTVASNTMTIEHNTFSGTHATRPTVDVQSRQTLSWNYAAAGGAAAAYGDSATAGAEWTAATRDKNASSDTSGDSSYQSIAYATGSGARFTSLTANAENFDIGVASSLRDLATDSGYVIDIKSRTRTTPDIGAFEYQAVGGSTPKRRAMMGFG